MALEQGFVIGEVTPDGTAACNVSLGFLPRLIIATNEAAVTTAFTFTNGTVTGSMLLDAAPNLDATNEIALYQGNDKMVYDGVTSNRWEADGVDAVITGKYVDEGGEIYPLRVIHKDPVDGAFVFTTPGFTIPGASTLNDGTVVQFAAFR